MENRSIFALDGITGMLVATVLLLVVEGTLVFLAIGVQQDVAQDYYYIEDAKSVKMFSNENASHVKLLKDK
ncbi:DUF4006 family protein [Sulfurimonas sp. MAG313]|nr:DUF4006 family protein [Sulfurimonas sp. MAG313]MDF1880826.1 DUF4006 family protein [Sulfurimonas sp. MAG313]